MIKAGGKRGSEQYSETFEDTVGMGLLSIVERSSLSRRLS